LPNLNIIEIVVKSNDLEDCDGQRMLVPLTAMDLNERRNARRQTLFDRVAKAAEIANACDSQVLVWCDLNDESKELTNQIDNAVEVTGSDTDEHKQNAMFDFTNGNIKCLVSKPKIAGWGMNWQNCPNVIFVGLSDSFESYYQAIRRCWRFGQTSEVNVYIITSDKESCVKQNIETKQAKAQTLTKELACLTRDIVINEMNGKIYKTSNYLPNEDMKIPQWIGE
jgi:superfamily II DNA helicase RecQ